MFEIVIFTSVVNILMYVEYFYNCKDVIFHYFGIYSHFVKNIKSFVFSEFERRSQRLAFPEVGATAPRGNEAFVKLVMP